jgi:hypothetical protein
MLENVDGLTEKGGVGEEVGKGTERWTMCKWDKGRLKGTEKILVKRHKNQPGYHIDNRQMWKWKNCIVVADRHFNASIWRI